MMARLIGRFLAACNQVMAVLNADVMCQARRDGALWHTLGFGGLTTCNLFAALCCLRVVVWWDPTFTHVRSVVVASSPAPKPIRHAPWETN